MTVMIVGGEVFLNIGLLIVVYFCIVFVLLYFLELIVRCTALYLFSLLATAFK